jgi:Cu-processing system ATP-binding protein
VISFQAFSKRYGALAAVQSLDLEVGAGEVVALLGPNGAGKTTSLKAVAGLVSPTSGAVRLSGRNAADPQAREVLSFLPQRVSFPEALSGREVLGELLRRPVRQRERHCRRPDLA